MANVQLEHGFLRIANALDLALIRAPLSAEQHAVARALLRLTYGYNRTRAEFTSRQLEEITHRPARHCRRALLDLERVGIAVRISEPRRGRSATWAVGKDFDRWDFTAIGKHPRPGPGEKSPGKGAPRLGHPGSERCPKAGALGAPRLGHLPSLCRKTVKDTHTPPPRGHGPPSKREGSASSVCVELFEAEYRKALGIPPVITASGRRHLRSLEQSVGAERIAAALPAYFRMRDETVREAGYPPGLLPARFSACELALRRAERRRELRSEREPRASEAERRQGVERLEAAFGEGWRRRGLDRPGKPS